MTLNMSFFFTFYLHHIYSHPLCSHALHVADQPMNGLSTDKAVEWQTFLLWQELHTCPVASKSKEVE